jgi:hypothetical protein
MTDETQPDGPYAAPIRGQLADQCVCYHRQTFPELAERNDWQWDLIGRESDYFGNFDFRNKRVLEFGAADGYLSFWLEQQGADIVATDLSPDADRHSWDIVNRVDEDVTKVRQNMSMMMRRLNNSFWFGHERHKSHAKPVHDTAYNVPREIGKFDVVTLGAILLHLRDPFRAIEHALEFSRDAIIISDLIPWDLSKDELARPLATFIPNPHIAAHGGTTWWLISPVVYQRYFELRGFRIASLTQGSFRHKSRAYEMFQLVAQRS